MKKKNYLILSMIITTYAFGNAKEHIKTDSAYLLVMIKK